MFSNLDEMAKAIRVSMGPVVSWDTSSIKRRVAAMRGRLVGNEDREERQAHGADAGATPMAFARAQARRGDVDRGPRFQGHDRGRDSNSRGGRGTSDERGLLQRN